MKKREPKKRGPPPELLKLHGDWAKNVKRALEKPKPPEGWPKEQKEHKEEDPEG